MKVLLVGDTHGGIREAQYAVSAAQSNDVELIIQLGDFGFKFARGFLDQWAVAPCPVYFLRGNHDDTDWLKERNGGHLTGDDPVEVALNIHYLPDGARLKIGDSWVAVLGGAVSIDRQHRREGVTWWRDEVTSAQGVADLLQHDFMNTWSKPKTVDVMLCHDVPECPNEIRKLIGGYKDDPGSEGNRKMLRHAFDYLRPSRLFHGHYHHPYVEDFEGCEVRGLDMDGRDAVHVVEF